MQANLLLFKPLKKLHTLHMSLTEYHYSRYHFPPKSDTVLDEWMAAAKQVLAGNQNQQGQTQGGKRIRMSYRWMGDLILDRNRVEEIRRFEDVEVD